MRQLVALAADNARILGKLAESNKTLSDSEAARRREHEEAKFSKKEDLVKIKAETSDSFMVELLEHEAQMTRMHVKGGKRLFERFREALRDGNKDLLQELEERQCPPGEGAERHRFAQAMTGTEHEDRAYL